MAAKPLTPEMAQAFREAEEILKNSEAAHRGGCRVLKEKYPATNYESLLEIISQELKQKSA